MLHSTWIGENLKSFPDVIRNFIKGDKGGASSGLHLIHHYSSTAVLPVPRFPCYCAHKTLSLKDSTRNPNTRFRSLTCRIRI